MRGCRRAKSASSAGLPSRSESSSTGQRHFGSLDDWLLPTEASSPTQMPQRLLSPESPPSSTRSSEVREEHLQGAGQNAPDPPWR